jgi:hypothetical protein
MSNEIRTVKDLIEHLKLFDENMKIALACGGAYGTGLGLKDESIQEEDGRVVIECEWLEAIK